MRRRHALALLVLLVAGLHMIVMSGFADRLRAFAPAGSHLQRMDVAFVHELKPVAEPSPAPAQPPVVASVPAPAARAASAPEAKPLARPRRQPVPRQTESPASPQPPTPLPLGDEVSAADAARAAASRSPLAARLIDEGQAPTADAPAPVVAVEPTPRAASALVDEDVAAGGSTRGAQAVATATFEGASPTDAVAGTPFGWPASTLLRYRLEGNYRGEVEGVATVQWIRKGTRYQVQLEVAIGPSFAPLMSRQMTSQGDLSDLGLVPRRYEERTRIGFSVRQFAMSFDGGRAVLANGATVPTRVGMQDASSQFVQLSYLFTTNPSLLQAGRSISLPVALPRRLDDWIYDVVGEETLATPIGDLRTFHLRPRRESPRQGELVAQAWYAPSLQYLPVRILIHQDADTFIDMRLDSAPLQAEPQGN